MLMIAGAPYLIQKWLLDSHTLYVTARYDWTCVLKCNGKVVANSQNDSSL